MAARQLGPGEIVGERFRVTGVLGRGGVGTTYSAEDMQTRALVALKELWLWRGQDWKTLDLFQREARVLAGLEHPAIPRYVAYFQVETQEGAAFYLAQTVAPGRSLATWVREGWRPSEAELRVVADGLLGVLEYLHGLSPPVIHRDVKPENVLRDEGGHLYLVDFGAVRDSYRSTAQGSTVVGTFGYMAPEQFRGQALPGTDLYGVGATCVHLLTHLTPAQLPQKKERPDFRSRARVSGPLEEWLDRMLAPEASRRFPSARAARLELARAARPRSRVLRLALIIAALFTVLVVLPLAAYVAFEKLSAPKQKPAGASGSEMIRVHEAPQSEKGRLQFDRQLTGHQGIVAVVAFVADGGELVSAGSDGAVKVWDLGTGRIARSLPGHQQRVFSGDVSRDGTLLFTSTNAEVRRWKLRTGGLDGVIPGTNRGVARVRVSPDGKHLAISGWAGDLTVSELDGKVVRTIPREGRGDALAFSPDGKWIAVAGKKPLIEIFDATTGERVAALEGHTATVGTVEFSPDGKHLVSASDDKTAKLWSFVPGHPSLLRSIEGFAAPVWTAAFSPDGSKLVVAGGGRLRVMEPISGEVIDSFESPTVHYTKAAFSKNGSLLAVGTAEWGVQLWNLREPSWRPPPVTSPVPATRFDVPADAPKQAQLVMQAKHLTLTGENRANVLAAKALLDQAIKIDSSYAPAWARLAKVEQDLGYRSGFDFERAALKQAHAHVDRALALDPKLVEAHVRLGYLHLYAKDFSKAHAAAETARGIRANDPEIELLEMDIAHLEEHPAEALLHARAVIEGSDDPGQRFRAYRRLADIYETRQEWDSAEICYVATTRLDPTSAWAHGNYAHYLNGRKQFDKAIDEANLAIGIRDYPMAHKYLAIAYAGKAVQNLDARGDLKQAEEWLERSRKEDPATPLGHIGRARLAWARGDRARARREIAEAVKLLPGNPEVQQLHDEMMRE
ncbi:MAG: protein kinase [Polyangiaceae bacterium]